MKRWVLLALGMGVLGAAAFWLLTAPRTLSAAALPDHVADLQNGADMFYAGGCGSCHARPGAKGEEKKKLAGGLALKSPFGTFYAPNISPDLVYGIGAWSPLEFVNALMRGVSPDGRHYYPAFPYTSYHRMALRDVLDLKAYLDTLPPVASTVPAHEVPFPFNIRRLLGGWKFLYFAPAPPDDTPIDAEPLSRGAYLVTGPGHCGECHSPRDALGGVISARALAGAANLEGEGIVPNLTPHADGLGAWSIADIAYSLETGFTPEFDSFGGSMVAVQENMANLSSADRQAIATYLKSLAPMASTKPVGK